MSAVNTKGAVIIGVSMHFQQHNSEIRTYQIRTNRESPVFTFQDC